jgi:hypothetical protein
MQLDDDSRSVEALVTVLSSIRSRLGFALNALSGASTSYRQRSHGFSRP